MSEGNNSPAGDGGLAGGQPNQPANQDQNSAGGGQKPTVGNMLSNTNPSTPAPTSGDAPPAGNAPSGGAGVPQEIIDWAANKGFKDADAIRNNPELYKLVTSYKHTESMVGSMGDKIAIPKDGADKDAWNEFYSKTGRPDKPDGYQMEVPQGGDSGFALKATEWFHEAGLNQQQASNLNQKWNEYVAGIETQMSRAAEQAAIEQGNKLTEEWGANMDANREVATRGWNHLANALNLDQAAQDKLSDALGVDGAMKLLKHIGEIAGTKGDSFEGDPLRQGGNLGMSPAEAQKKIDKLIEDRAFQDRRKKGDKTATEEWGALHKLAAQLRKND